MVKFIKIVVQIVRFLVYLKLIIFGRRVSLNNIVSSNDIYE